MQFTSIFVGKFIFITETIICYNLSQNISGWIFDEDGFHMQVIDMNCNFRCAEEKENYFTRV